MKKTLLFSYLLMMYSLVGFCQTLSNVQREKAESAVKKYFSLLAQYAEHPMGAEAFETREEIIQMFENLYNAPIYNDLQVLKQKTNLGASCTIDDYLLSFGLLNNTDGSTFRISYDSIICHPLLEPSYAEGYDDLNALVYVSKRIEGGDIAEKLTNVIRYNLNAGKISYIEKASFTTSDEDVNFLLKNHLGYSTAKLNEMASRCYQEKKYKQAYRLYEQAAKRDDIDSQFALANMLYKRQGCEEYGEFATRQMTKFWLKKIYFKYMVNAGVRLFVGIWEPAQNMIKAVFKDEPSFEVAAENEPFNSGLMKYKVPGKGLYGFIDTKGKIVIPTIYGQADAFSEGLARTYKDGKWGYIDPQGNIRIPFMYKEATSFINGTATVALEKTIGGVIRTNYFIINKKGEKISEDFDYIAWRSSKSEMLMVAKRGNKWGFVNGFGKIKVPFIYDGCLGENPNSVSSADHIIPILKDGKWGFIDTGYSEGKVIVRPQYEKAGTFRFGMAWVHDGTGVSFINKTGKVICGKYFTCSPFNPSGLAMVQYKPGNEACLINKRGEIVYYCNVDEKGNLSNIRREEK